MTNHRRVDISVIIPTYNRAAVLPRALDSVLAQSRPPAELIVVDDGSTDGTASLVHERYPDAIYIPQANRGVSGARNRGISRASSSWIAFLDSDDAWLPDKLRRQVDSIEAEVMCQVCHTDEIWIRNGRRANAMKKHAKSGGWIFRQCLPRCCISPSSILMHRRVFDAVGTFDETLPACEDYDLWLRVTAVFPVHFVAEPLLTKYGGHDDQLSRSYWGMDRFRVRALEKILASGILQPEDAEAARRMLIDKLCIYLQGARKRGGRDEVMVWEAKLRRARLAPAPFPTPWRRKPLRNVS
ncbi:MAG: glycosyltransferase family 2 protein [Acidobacteriota bacterium]